MQPAETVSPRPAAEALLKETVSHPELQEKLTLPENDTLLSSFLEESIRQRPPKIENPLAFLAGEARIEEIEAIPGLGKDPLIEILKTQDRQQIQENLRRILNGDQSSIFINRQTLFQIAERLSSRHIPELGDALRKIAESKQSDEFPKEIYTNIASSILARALSDPETRIKIIEEVVDAASDPELLEDILSPQAEQEIRRQIENYRFQISIIEYQNNNLLNGQNSLIEQAYQNFGATPLSVEQIKTLRGKVEKQRAIREAMMEEISNLSRSKTTQPRSRSRRITNLTREIGNIAQKQGKAEAELEYLEEGGELIFQRIETIERLIENNRRRQLQYEEEIARMQNLLQSSREATKRIREKVNSSLAEGVVSYYENAIRIAQERYEAMLEEKLKDPLTKLLSSGLFKMEDGTLRFTEYQSTDKKNHRLIDAAYDILISKSSDPEGLTEAFEEFLREYGPIYIQAIKEGREEDFPLKNLTPQDLLTLAEMHPEVFQKFAEKWASITVLKKFEESTKARMWNWRTKKIKPNEVRHLFRALGMSEAQALKLIEGELGIDSEKIKAALFGEGKEKSRVKKIISSKWTWGIIFTIIRLLVSNYYSTFSF